MHSIQTDYSKVVFGANHSAECVTYRKTPNRNSRPMVMAAEMSSEPTQPNRFEKKKNNLQFPFAR
jgi:hypothetical protein